MNIICGMWRGGDNIIIGRHTVWCRGEEAISYVGCRGSEIISFTVDTLCGVDGKRKFKLRFVVA